jgi:hypothetical protein
MTGSEDSHELNAEAQQVSPEFKVLFEESMK